MYCPNCGCDNPSDAAVCKVCSTSLSPAQNDNKPTPPGDSKRKLLIAAIAVLGVLVIAGSAFAVKLIHDKKEPRITDAVTTTMTTTEKPETSASGGAVSETSESTTEKEKEKKKKKKKKKTKETTATTAAKPETTTRKPSTTRKPDCITSTARQERISGWVLAKNAPRNAKIKSEKWTYEQLDYISSSEKQSKLNGYTYFSETTSTDYSSWSGWSTTRYYDSSTRQTESRKMYRFHAFVCSKCGSRDPYSTPCDYCGTSSVMRWEETYFDFPGSSRSYTDIGGKPRISYGGKYWYFEYNNQSNGDGGVGQPSRTEYRYRDQYTKHIYWYEKRTPRESSKRIYPAENIDNIQKWVKYVIK